MLKAKNLKIVYIINHASFFVSHRIELLLKAKKLINAEVYLIIGKAGSNKMEKHALKYLKKKKVKYFQTSFVSSYNGIIADIKSLFQIYKILKKIKPDIVHSASPKANFLTGLLSILLDSRFYIFSVSGMGYLFTKNKKKLIEVILKNFYNLLYFILKKKKNICFILQNKADFNYFKNKFGKGKIVLIPSSGVDLKKFKFEKKKTNLVIMPSRILYDKGVSEYFRAAKILKKKYKNWTFKLIGAEDYNNPTSVPVSELNNWQRKGYIKWESYKNNIRQIYQNASIVCLPSHREGFSKVILEAGAASLPIVASKIPGCQEGILDGKTGYLFKVKDHKDLSLKLEILIKNKQLRYKFGKNAHNFVKKNFEVSKINKDIIDLYIKCYE